VTHPPWLHQFSFEWTSAHIVIELNPIIKFESHILFCPCSKVFFFILGPILLTQLPCSKTNSHLPCSSTYVYDFFLKFFFHFCHHCRYCHKLKKHGHCPSSRLMFKEKQRVVATWRFKKHEVQHIQENTTRYVFYIFFSAFEVYLDFQFGFRLMFIFALPIFKVHQRLNSTLTSSTFKWLELVVMIIVKPTNVGMTIVGMTLL